MSTEMNPQSPQLTNELLQRILGPVEGLTGILMCGLSAGLFFGLITRIYSSQLSPKPNTP